MNQGLEKIVRVLLFILLHFTFVQKAKADGRVDLTFEINGSSPIVEFIKYPGSLDSYDKFDTDYLEPPSGNPFAYIDISTHKLRRSTQPGDNPKNGAYGWIGLLEQDSNVLVHVDFPYDPAYMFPDEESLTLRQLDLQGTVLGAWDLRDVYFNQGKTIDLIGYAQAGTYSTSQPLGGFQIDFDPVEPIPEPVSILLFGSGAIYLLKKENERSHRKYVESKILN